MLNNFYRKKLKFNNNITIEFQVIDWASYDDYDSEDDEEQESSEEFEHPSSDDEPTRKIRNYNIKAYGSTERGNTVCVHIKNFKPYFFVKIPLTWGIPHFKAFISKVKMMVGEYNAGMLCKAEMIHKKDFYGFTDNKQFKFAKFTFHNKSGFYNFQRKLEERVIKIHKYGINHNFKNDLYESKIDPMLRFFHEKDINPCGWIKLNAKDYTINSPSKTRSQIDVTIDYQKIISIEKNKISPMIIASFDIECTSEDGTFPNPHRKADEVIQIGTTFHKYGESKCYLKHIVTLKRCNPIEGKEEDPDENTFVESYTTEKEVLIAWAKLISRIDPDVITGYNIWGFDWTFLYERSLCKFNDNRGNYSELFLSKLSKVIDKPAKLKEKELRSAALGDNTLKWIDIEGVVQIDLLKLIQKDHNLDSYKLDAVAHTFMGLNKVDLSPKQLFANYRDGSPEKIKEIAVYCIKDCELVNHLIMKLEVIANNIGMGNVCLVPFSYLFMRGQGIKIFSVVAQICRQENFLIKNIDKDSVDQSSYEGAIVFDPKPGVYFEPIAVMDYASLYPSSMISENISHDSIVSVKEYDLEDTLIKEDGDKKYDNLPNYNYSDIQYDVFKLVIENGKEDKKKVGYKICRFAEHKNGEKALLPRTLKKLLTARKDTRKKIKYQTITTNEGTECYGLLKEKEELYEVHDIDTEQYTTVDKKDIKDMRETYNDFEKAVLDGLQLAYKVVCNSLYGQVGAATSSICYKELAASTTATGRKMVTLARDYTLEKFKGSKLVYGDSIVGDEPLLLQDKDGRVTIKTIETLSNEWEPYENFKVKDTIESNRREKEKAFTDYKVWSNGKWNVIKKVIRHKTNKQIYRVQTGNSVIDVTEDHSLMNEHGVKLKPNDCIIGTTRLKHSFPTEFQHIMNIKIPNNLTYNQIIIETSDKLLLQKYYYHYKSHNIELSIETHDDIYKLTYRKSLSPNILTKIYKINKKEDMFVYDLETENGDFNAGIGEITVFNTDSIFVSFVDYIKEKHKNEKNITEKDMLKYTIEVGEEAGAYVTSKLKKPQNLEYEKVFWPFCIFSKKRYFGNKYEFSTEKYKQTSMGIVLKRRDNAPIVKDIYAGVIDIILNKKDIESAKGYFKEEIANLLKGNVDLSKLIISKTLRGHYANPTQIAHKVLADRMGERDPGNKPAPSDRIPYCYIDEKKLVCEICPEFVNPKNCKCIDCMKLYCKDHLHNHRNDCMKSCKFCRTKVNVEQCNTCTALFCEKCMTQHKKKTDKFGRVSYDKCKKRLTNKILQGDIIEYPPYVKENNIQIDYRYYLDHQIQKPVMQIFELVMKNPESIIESIIRKDNNRKSGAQEITKWFGLV